MIRALIWDLDDTLLDTTGLLIPIARTPAFEARIREPLPLLEGALANLEALSPRYICLLLTYGRVEAQKQKVASLGIEKFFRSFYFADPNKSETKSHYFAKIPGEWKLQPSEVMSIGNRRTTDIGEAKDFGLITCHYRYGEHQDEKPARPQEVPDFEVDHHRDLVKTCRL